MSVPYSEGKKRVTLGVSEAHFMLLRELDEIGDLICTQLQEVGEWYLE